MDNSKKNHNQENANQRNELLTFLFLGLALAPMLSAALIGGYGLLVWVLE